LPTFSSKPEVSKKFIEGELVSKDLIVVQTDKSGKFAILDKESFNSKALDSVDKLFKPFGLKSELAKNKSLILSLVKNGDDDLKKLATKITQTMNDCFAVKCVLKDHKADMPFRIIINELGTWQYLVSRFIKRSLEVLPDPN